MLRRPKMKSNLLLLLVVMTDLAAHCVWCSDDGSQPVCEAAGNGFRALEMELVGLLFRSNSWIELARQHLFTQAPVRCAAYERAAHLSSSRERPGGREGGSANLRAIGSSWVDDPFHLALDGYVDIPLAVGKEAL